MSGFQFFAHNDPDAVRIELAGSLRAADAETLHQAWQRAALKDDPVKPVIVDITFVRAADEQGRALLIAMHRSGVRIVAQSPESSAIARPIVIQPIETHDPKPGWFHRLTMHLLEEQPVGTALPAQAENRNHASAGSRHANVEYMRPHDHGVLEDAVR